MKHRGKRIQAAIFAALLLCTEAVGQITAYGAQAEASVEESVYVNLDYYGVPTVVNVVKTLRLNGRSSYTDYGQYQTVKNMSDQREPVLKDGSVTWNFDGQGSDRFYYQCSVDKDQAVLPWKFDVSYRLNGVPADGDQLAGASGLVEIRIQAEPNENAPEYYRNNMVLLVAVPVDRNTCRSVEADGAQIQSAGNNTFVAFSALPGEKGDFTVRLGTDCFETIGILMAMAPGTVKDLEHIQDLKETKDTWKGAGDELYDSMDQMAASVEAMEGGVNQLIRGLQSAEETRTIWSGSKDAIFSGNDRALESLSAVSEQIKGMVPHIQTAKDSAQAVHDSMKDLVTILGEMQDPMRRLNSNLRSLKSDMETATGDVAELSKLMEKLILLDASLSASEQVYITQLGILAQSLAAVEADYYEDMDEAEELLELSSVSGLRLATSSNASGVTMDAVQLMQALSAKKTCLEAIQKASKQVVSTLSSILDSTGSSAKRAAEIIECMDLMIEDLTALNNTLDMYYPELQDAFDDSKKLAEQTAGALDDCVDTLSLIQDTLKASSDRFDAAAKDSILGSMELLDKSLGLLDSTASMRNAGRTMKDTLDQEWTDLEQDTRFLFMDPTASKISFTSEKNPSPETLQIVLRTKEISLDSQEETLDAEPQTVKEARPLVRMWNVVVKIWQAIVDIFRNR